MHFNGSTYYLIDTPGHVDFAGDGAGHSGHGRRGRRH